jgi:putative hydrolase of the HAD superfamily
LQSFINIAILYDNIIGKQGFVRTMTDKRIGLAFDIGDTIINAKEMQKNAIEQTAQMLHKRELIDNVALFVSKYSDYDKEFDGAAVNHLFSIPLDIMSKTLYTFSITKSIHLYSALSFYRKKIREQIHLNNRLVDLLIRLKGKEYKLGIVSDGTIDEQIYTLSKMGIIDLFDTIIISEAIGVTKPDRRMFEAVINGLAIEPENIFIIGDDFKKDIIGGIKCGLKTIWVTELARIVVPDDYEKYVDIKIDRRKIYTIDSVLEYFWVEKDK